VKYGIHFPNRWDIFLFFLCSFRHSSALLQITLETVSKCDLETSAMDPPNWTGNVECRNNAITSGEIFNVCLVFGKQTN